MTSSPNTDIALAPIALTADEGEALWAFGGLALLKSTASTTGGRVMVSEQRAPAAAARRCMSITARTSGST